MTDVISPTRSEIVEDPIPVVPSTEQDPSEHGHLPIPIDDDIDFSDLPIPVESEFCHEYHDEKSQLTANIETAVLDAYPADSEGPIPVRSDRQFSPSHASSDFDDSASQTFAEDDYSLERSASAHDADWSDSLEQYEGSDDDLDSLDDLDAPPSYRGSPVTTRFDRNEVDIAQNGIYSINPAPMDYIKTMRNSAKRPLRMQALNSRSSFGSKSLREMYSSLKGSSPSSVVWDNLLSTIPDYDISRPTLDVGCGKGRTLMKLAQRKTKIMRNFASFDIQPAYGVDNFCVNNQGQVDAVESIYQGAGSLGLLDSIVLHTVDYSKLPFRDGSFSLVTSNIALHSLDRKTRVEAIAEMVRVCAPGGWIIILDVQDYLSEYEDCLRLKGWTHVDSKSKGIKASYGKKPCRVLKARKPFAKKGGSHALMQDDFDEEDED